MITCPRCGAENKPTATVCRMCATTLDPTAGLAAPRPGAGAPSDAPATVLIPSPGAPSPMQQYGMPGPAAGKVTCPGCQASNDADWAFCQQCGTRLQGAPPFQPSPPQQPPPQQPTWGAPTVVTPAPGYGQPPSSPDPWQQMPYNTPHSPADMATVVSPSLPPPPPDPSAYAPTVVSPMPQMPPQMPPQAPDPNAFAPTVITPVPHEFFAQAKPSAPQQPQHGGGYPAASDDLVTSGSPHEAPPQPNPAYGATQYSGSSTASQGALPSEPPAERTIVMSSTPVAAPPKQAKLMLIMEGGETGDTYDLRSTETVIGRVDGDIKFPHDGYMSGRHARVIQRNGHFYLLDNNSRNGTFIKIHQEVELNPGDILLVGKQLFRFEVDE
jgi:hypothetical protein